LMFPCVIRAKLETKIKPQVLKPNEF